MQKEFCLEGLNKKITDRILLCRIANTVQIKTVYYLKGCRNKIKTIYTALKDCRNKCRQYNALYAETNADMMPYNNNNNGPHWGLYCL